MAGTLESFSSDVNLSKDFARYPSKYVSARVLAANASEQVTIPTGAVYAWIEVTADVYFAFGSNPTAAVPTDLDDGTANERIGNSEGKPLKVDQLGGKLAFVSAGVAIVTVSFYKS